MLQSNNEDKRNVHRIRNILPNMRYVVVLFVVVCICNEYQFVNSRFIRDGSRRTRRSLDVEATNVALDTASTVKKAREPIIDEGGADNEDVEDWDDTENECTKCEESRLLRELMKQREGLVGDFGGGRMNF